MGVTRETRVVAMVVMALGPRDLESEATAGRDRDQPRLLSHCIDGATEEDGT